MRVVPLLCVTAAVLVPAAARADLIMPASVPVPVVGSAQNTPVPTASYLVTNQYAGPGVVFPPGMGAIPGTGPTVVVTSMGGVDVWVPATRTEAVADRVAVVDYRGTISGQLLHPAGALTVEVVGAPGEVLSAYDPNGHLIGFAPLTGLPGPHGGTLLTIQGPDISSFVVTGPLLMGADAAWPWPPAPQPWGVAGVQFTPVTAAEPAAWMLAVLGAAGLAWRGRRTRAPW
jgi:hypothetical protein